MAEPGLEAFLAAAGWASAARAALAGDASARRYLRLARDGADSARAVLMISPPEAAAETARFAALAGHLTAAGLSAPAVLAAAPEAGFLLLEDLGDELLARLAAGEPAREPELYAGAVDAIVALQAVPVPPDLPAPDAGTMAALIDPVTEWYAPDSPPEALAALTGALAPPLAAACAGPAVLCHRDCHAENLLWLPDRAGPARIGLLDFQDAFAGPPAYDLVSLLEDARRDVAPATRAACLARFAAATGTDPDRLAADVAAIGAQRNLRILGVFARLSRLAGKPRYIDLIPRVWDHLQGDLAHPALAGLRDAARQYLSPPSAAHLDALRRPCQTGAAR